MIKQESDGVKTGSNGSEVIGRDGNGPMDIDREEDVEKPKMEVVEEKVQIGTQDLFGADSPPPTPPLHDENSGVKAEEEDEQDVDYKGKLRTRDRPSGSGSGDQSPSSASAIASSSTPRTRPSSPTRSRPTMQSRQSRKKSPPPPPRLCLDLPTAWDEAHETFEVLERCVYERKELGLSREQDDMMVCDCVFDKRDHDAEQCGSNSDCVNRAIFIECLAKECRARGQCRNQRFSKRQYAPVDIIDTEKKGFGLRAADDIPSGSLIYEYIGEVIAEKTFRKRMQQYADEGIRHFYFMMLQKEEYIDATKKGGIGRFANHSCNPNSEVQKWVVGRRLRMGIFTKRDVLRGEEITFNYNVDRYGHDAQLCYCGEPNCVGTIGGKTQTDIGGMTDLMLDALGIRDEVEALEMKGSKKKKSRQLDDIDYIPILKPITGDEPQKVAAAMRQSLENSKMMSKLLQRIKITEEPVVHRQLMRMHGFSLMSIILTDMSAERDTILVALEAMEQWRLQEKNKIDDSNIEDSIRELATGNDPEISQVAQKLLDYWSTLELSYKIPRKSKIDSLDADDEAATTTIAEADSLPTPTPDHRRPRDWENNTEIRLVVAPVRPRPPPLFNRPKPPLPSPLAKAPSQQAATRQSNLDAIVAQAQQTLAAAAAAAAASADSNGVQESPAESSRSGSRPLEDVWEAEERLRQREREKMERKRHKRNHQSSTSTAEDEQRKEKKLTKMVGDVVVRAMSKYKEQMEHDTFKRYAKECTGILVEKEKKGHSYANSRLSALSEDKKAKMKAFTKEFAHKVLKRLKEKGKLKRPSSNGHGNSTTPAASASLTPALSTPTPARSSSGLETPSRNGGETGDKGDKELVDDIFGESDEEMDLDVDNDDEGASSLAIKTPADPTGTSPFGGSVLEKGTPQGKPMIAEGEPSPEDLS